MAEPERKASDVYGGLDLIKRHLHQALQYRIGEKSEEENARFEKHLDLGKGVLTRLMRGEERLKSFSEFQLLEGFYGVHVDGVLNTLRYDAEKAKQFIDEWNSEKAADAPPGLDGKMYLNLLIYEELASDNNFGDLGDLVAKP